MHHVERVKHRLTRKIMPVRLSGLGVDGFEGYASVFGARDGIGDIVAPGAFAASLRRRGPSGVRMLYQHFAYEPIGVWDEIKEDARGLYVRGHLVMEVERARDVAALLREGALGGLSIGFKTVRAKKEAATGTRTLLQVDLWEISVVTFPLLEAASVTAVGDRSSALAAKIRQMTAVLKA
ncbi:MAG TPA: HK97 family phage prohead protease [Micropepsaceae bacterium]|nr:HK97 family phage prohead protease [Micropepsaceae bacterium]